MAFDYKKEYKEYYMPKAKPEIIEIPPMNYIAVRGVGDPNEEGGAYKEAIGQLYGIAFTLKMSKKAHTRSKDILIMSCRRWRASGGSPAWRVSIIKTSRISTGYPLSAFRIS